jgi:hypothetical protein
MENTSTAQWTNQIVAHTEEPPEKLAAHPLNYRIHNLAQRRATFAALKEVGQVKSVVVNRRTGRILDGHLRVALAVNNQQPTIAVEWVDVPENQEAAIIAMLNFTESMADVDDERLTALMREVQVKDPQLQEVLTNQANKLLPNRGNRENGEDGEEPEFQIAPELYERQDYLVFYFDNEFDWQVACDIFGVKTMLAPASDARSSLMRKGVGRVLPGKRLLAVAPSVDELEFDAPELPLSELIEVPD